MALVGQQQRGLLGQHAAAHSRSSIPAAFRPHTQHARVHSWCGGVQQPQQRAGVLVRCVRVLCCVCICAFVWLLLWRVVCASVGRDLARVANVCLTLCVCVHVYRE